MTDLSESLDDETEAEAEARGLSRHFRVGGLGNDTAWGALHDLSQLMVMMLSFTLLGRQLGVDGYGRYAGVYGIVGPIGGLTWSGIMLAILQRSIREQDDSDKVARDFFGLSVGLGSVAVVVGSIIGSQIIGGLAVSTIVAVMVAELLANAVTSVSIAMVQARRTFAHAARLRMVTLGIRLTVLLALTVTDSLTIAHLAIGFTIGFIVYLVVLITRVLPSYGIRFQFARPGEGIVKVTASISLPIGAAVMQQDGDKAVLNAYGFANDAGLYAAAFRVVSMGLMPLRALEGAAFQRFLPHNEDERNEHTRRAARFGVLALGISLVLAAALFIGGRFLNILIGDEFAGAEDMIPWLLPFLPLTALSNAPANGLLGLGKLGVRAGVYATAALISVSLYVTLVPSMSWKGAVVGTLVGEASQALLGWVALLHFQRQHNATLDVETSASLR